MTYQRPLKGSEIELRTVALLLEVERFRKALHSVALRARWFNYLSERNVALVRIAGPELKFSGIEDYLLNAEAAFLCKKEKASCAVDEEMPWCIELCTVGGVSAPCPAEQGNTDYANTVVLDEASRQWERINRHMFQDMAEQDYVIALLDFSEGPALDADSELIFNVGRQIGIDSVSVIAKLAQVAYQASCSASNV